MLYMTFSIDQQWKSHTFVGTLQKLIMSNELDLSSIKLNQVDLGSTVSKDFVKFKEMYMTSVVDQSKMSCKVSMAAILANFHNI